MLMQRLKQETQALHTALEQTPLSAGLMRPDLTLATYSILLQKFYGYHAPLEAALGRFDWNSLNFNFDERRKVSYLERDLALLGINPRYLPLCQQLPPLYTIPQALGCLYVMEGSTLGGQFINRHLTKQLTLGHYSYFSSYGDQVGPMWKSFGSLVNSYTHDPAIEDEIVESANQTFATLQTWLEQVEVLASVA